MNKCHHQKRKLKKKYRLLFKLSLTIIAFLMIKIKVFNNKKVKNTMDQYVFNNILNANPIGRKNKEAVKIETEAFVIAEKKEDSPIVYLYNTHDTESYAPLNEINYRPTIINATDYLNEKINEKGIRSVHEKRSMSDYLVENNLNYSSSYKASRFYMEDYTQNNPTIKYLFDIHRDSGKKELTTLCTDNKCYAKLLFLIGLENEKYQDNENYALILSRKINEKLPGLSKGILQKSGPKVNGVYNEDFSNRTILIEVGGENNLIEEVYNTLDILSDVIVSFIKEENYGR